MDSAVFNINLGNSGRVLDEIRKIRKELQHMSAKFDSIEGFIGEVKTSLDDIASDLDDLMAQVAGGLSPAEADQVVTDMTALRDRIAAVSAEWPPAPPPVA